MSQQAFLGRNNSADNSLVSQPHTGDESIFNECQEMLDRFEAQSEARYSNQERRAYDMGQDLAHLTAQILHKVDLDHREKVLKGFETYIPGDCPPGCTDHWSPDRLKAAGAALKVILGMES